MGLWSARGVAIDHATSDDAEIVTRTHKEMVDDDFALFRIHGVVGESSTRVYTHLTQHGAKSCVSHSRQGLVRQEIIVVAPRDHVPAGLVRPA